MTKRAIFLDRDGVIVVPEFRDGRSFAPKTLEQFQYFPDIKITLNKLKAAGFILIVVTNQPDVGNGKITKAIVEAMHHKMMLELPLEAIETCYHKQTDNCHCRKPKPGMLEHAIARYSINPKLSYMIGDRNSDIAAGKQIGCKTIFIEHYYQEPMTIQPNYICSNLSEVCNWLCLK